MAKAPGESRIPTFGSRIPIPGKFRFLPNIALRNTSTNLKQDTNKTCIIDKPPPEIDRTITVSSVKSETMSPPKQRNCNKTILIQKSGSENSDPNCTVTLDANSAEATFVMKCIKREKSHSPARSTANSGITMQDIGKRVCVGNAQSGKLKYLGEVRFSTGLWCGVELDEPVGKHDGCVKGVRYFTCLADCGILAPVNKVTLLLDNKPSCDTTFNKVTVEDHGDSGPYSLLEVEDVRVNSNDALNCDEDELNNTLVLNEERVEQDLVINVNPVPALSVNNRLSMISGNIISSDKNNVDLRKTYTPPSDCSFNCASASTPMTERRNEMKKKFNDSISDSSCSPNKLNVTVVKAIDLNKGVNITPVHSPNEIPSLTKQNSFELDESLGILTPDQMVDFSSFIKNAGSASSDDLKSILAKHNERLSSASRTPSSENLGAMSKDGFKLPLTTVPISARFSAIQDQKTIVDTVKLPSSEDLKSLIYSNQNVLTQNTRTDILQAVNDSLVILTPDTGSVFTDDLKLILAKHNERLSLTSRSHLSDPVKLPSSEDLKSLISSNQNVLTDGTRIERQNTLSRTPSSENLCSEVKFNANSITCDSSKICDESSLMILTPEQMELSVFDATKTSSSENLKSILCSNRSDKTISNSRTPSSENLGSLPHDAFKEPLPVESLEVKEESLSLSRPCSIDLKSSSDPMKSLKISSSHQADVSSPNAVENSMIDFSLGLLEEDMLATGNQFSSMIDTTTNLELPLDSISGDKIEPFKSLSRSDQTPSPEDLPLDPIDPIKPVEMDIIEPNLLLPSTDSDPKTDVSKSTTTTKTNSFITSVTSITSLDTGYQGDGEMSRPASRGADHSPMAHKPNNPALVNLQWQRAIARRQDPMTDSDFFTESDADIHEENVPRGDRRAQVIDGNLYGPNAQAPAAQDIFIGNQEEMDSSGIFTDLDMNPRADDFSDGERNRMNVVNEDKSPSEISTKSITENSQEIKEPEDLESTLVNETQDTSIIEVTESISEKPKSPTQSITSNSSRKIVRARTDPSKEENSTKKFKMPKRNVTSKVKTMMEQKKDIENQENRKPTRKPTGKWDAVMNKISQGKEENKTKIRLKEVKSKVSTGITGTPSTKRCEIQKTDTNTFVKPKIRRVRARGEALAVTKSNTQASSSVHSSLSDLSISQLSHNNKSSISSVSPENGTIGISSIQCLVRQDSEQTDDDSVDTARRRYPRPSRPRVSKKRETVGRCTPPVTEVLTPGGHKPAPVTSSRTATITSSRTREFQTNWNEPDIALKSILKHNHDIDYITGKSNENKSRRRRRKSHKKNVENNFIVLKNTNFDNSPGTSYTRKKSDFKYLANEVRNCIPNSRSILKKYKDKVSKVNDIYVENKFNILNILKKNFDCKDKDFEYNETDSDIAVETEDRIVQCTNNMDNISLNSDNVVEDNIFDDNSIIYESTINKTARNVDNNFDVVENNNEDEVRCSNILNDNFLNCDVVENNKEDKVLCRIISDDMDNISLESDVSVENNNENDVDSNNNGKLLRRIIMDKSLDNIIENISIDSDTEIVKYNKNNIRSILKNKIYRNNDMFIRSDTSIAKYKENKRNILLKSFDNEDSTSAGSDIAIENKNSQKRFLLHKFDNNYDDSDNKNFDNTNSLKSILRNKFDNTDSISVDSGTNTFTSNGNSLRSILKNNLENCDNFSTDSNNETIFENKNNYKNVVRTVSRTVLKRHSENRVKFCLECDSNVARRKSSYVPGRGILKKNYYKNNLFGDSDTVVQNRIQEKHISNIIFKNNFWNSDNITCEDNLVVDNKKPKPRSSNIPRRVFWFGSPHHFENNSNKDAIVDDKIVENKKIDTTNLKSEDNDSETIKNIFKNSENDNNSGNESDTKTVIEIKSKVSGNKQNFPTDNNSEKSVVEIKNNVIENNFKRNSKNFSRKNFNNNFKNDDNSDTKTFVEMKNQALNRKIPEYNSNNGRITTGRNSVQKTSREKWNKNPNPVNLSADIASKFIENKEIMQKQKSNSEKIDTIDEKQKKDNSLLRSIRKIYLNNNNISLDNKNVASADSPLRERNVVSRVPRIKIYRNRTSPDKNLDNVDNNVEIKKELKAVNNTPRMCFDRDRLCLRSPESGLNRISNWSAQGLRMINPHVRTVSSPLRLRIPVSARSPVGPRPTEIPQLILKKSPPAAPIDRRAASRRPGATLPAKAPSTTSASGAARGSRRNRGKRSNDI